MTDYTCVGHYNITAQANINTVNVDSNITPIKRCISSKIVAMKLILEINFHNKHDHHECFITYMTSPNPSKTVPHDYKQNYYSMKCMHIHQGRNHFTSNEKVLTKTG